MEKHKAVDYLRKVQSYRRTASEAPLTMTFRWRANGCPNWLRSVFVQVYCNEYGKIMRQTLIKPTMSKP